MPIMKQLIPNGGSKALVLPKPFLDAIGADAAVDVDLQGDRIIVTAHRYATDGEFKAAKARVFTKRAGLMKRLAKR